MASVLAPGESFGRFEIRDLDAPLLSSRVYRAFDPDLGRVIILEIAREDLSEAGRGLFLDRARALQKIDDPALAPVREIGEHGGDAYAIRDVPGGEPLARFTAPGRADEKLGWIARLASALRALGQGGLTHGAVSLENAFAGDEGKIALAVPIGGAPTSADDDVKALGRLAFELVVGRDTSDVDHDALVKRLVGAGIPREAAAILTRARENAVAIDELAKALEIHTSEDGPSTVPLAFPQPKQPSGTPEPALASPSAPAIKVVPPPAAAPAPAPPARTAGVALGLVLIVTAVALGVVAIAVVTRPPPSTSFDAGTPTTLTTPSAVTDTEGPVDAGFVRWRRVPGASSSMHRPFGPRTYPPLSGSALRLLDSDPPPAPSGPTFKRTLSIVVAHAAPEINEATALRVITIQRPGLQRCYDSIERVPSNTVWDVVVGSNGSVTKIDPGVGEGTIVPCLRRVFVAAPFPAFQKTDPDADVKVSYSIAVTAGM